MRYVYQTPLKGKNIGVVFGAFAPLHQGHLDMIMRAKKENDGGCIVIVCGYDGDKGEPLMPHNKRYRYVREFFSDDELVGVYPINDTELGIDNDDIANLNGWDIWLEEFFNIWNTAVDKDNLSAKRTWYIGDEVYKKGLEERGEDVILLDRTENPISATMIRDNPIKYWDKIMLPFRRIFSTNILITGTSSEGKTTLAKDLGKYFNAPYSHEWPRDYMIENCVDDVELDGADFLAFIQGQYNLNKTLINSPANNGIFFSDTDAIITRMYAEYYMKDKNFVMTDEEFKTVAALADELTRKSRWDKIFLIAPHGKFVDDHSRYMGNSGLNERQELYEILCRNLNNAGLWDKVTILNGNYYENFITVVEYVKGIIENGKD